MKKKSLVIVITGCFLLVASVFFLSGNNSNGNVAFAYEAGHYIAGTQTCEHKPGEPPAICTTRPCCADGNLENCMEGLCLAHCQPKVGTCKANELPTGE